MRVEATAAKVGRHPGSPLCRHYVSLHLVNLPVSLEPERHDGGQLVRWAIGVLPNGENELAGVWCCPRRSDASWSADAVEEMRSRGVETIRLVVIHDSGTPSEAMRPRFVPLAAAALARRWLKSSSAAAPLHSGHVISAALRLKGPSRPPSSKKPDAVGGDEHDAAELWASFALSSNLRRLVAMGHQSVLVSQKRLQRAVARHGAFDSQREAIAFAETVLLESEPFGSRRSLGRRRDAQAEPSGSRHPAVADKQR